MSAHARAAAYLTIGKAVSPATVAENGTLTYTFTIQNYGNTAAAETDNVTVSDTFSPILKAISVTYNGVAWTEGTQYTYNAAVQNFELSFRSLYDSVQSYASALNAAKVSLECERSDLAAAQLRYEQGTISENALHTAEDELYTAQGTVSGAERDLFTAYNNYRWAVDYGLLAG